MCFHTYVAFFFVLVLYWPWWQRCFHGCGCGVAVNMWPCVYDLLYSIHVMYCARTLSFIGLHIVCASLIHARSCFGRACVASLYGCLSDVMC